MSSPGAGRAMLVPLAIAALLWTGPVSADPKLISFPAPTVVNQLQLTRPFTLQYVAGAEFNNNGAANRRRLRLTLSYNAGRLLYRSDDLDSGVTHTMLYDGRETFQMDTNSPIAEIYPGFDFSRFLFCPIPGVGLPNMPLMDSGFPLIPQTKAALAKYRPGEAAVVKPGLLDLPGERRDYGGYGFADRNLRDFGEQGISSLVWLPVSSSPQAILYETYGNIPPNLGRLWEFFGHERFEGVWLATAIRYRWWATTVKTHSNTLLQSATYRLVSASEQPLAPTAFEPEAYLAKHASVTDETGPVVRAFGYYAGKGSLEEQRRGETEPRLERALQSKSPVNTGVIGLIVVAFMLAIWFIWRRGRRSD